MFFRVSVVQHTPDGKIPRTITIEAPEDATDADLIAKGCDYIWRKFADCRDTVSGVSVSLCPICKGTGERKYKDLDDFCHFSWVPWKTEMCTCR